MKEIISINSITNLPIELVVNDRNYFLNKNSNDEYILISNICPHLGADMMLKENCIECPVHFWKFDLDGKPINVKGDGLSFTILKKIDDKLYLENEGFLMQSNTFQTKKLHQGKQSIDFKLHSHASVEIIFNNYSILTDPWFFGTAFLDSWINYPESKVSLDTLNPNIIYISHEHSDHLHEETLLNFKKDIKICYPDFPNRRIGKILKKLGFNNLMPLKFGQTYELTNKINITCYEPKSLWNDSILFIEIDNFKILNTNDAGINQKIKNLVGEIDLLMAGFSTTASGFPATWDHISLDKKVEYYINAVSGTYSMLENSMRTYNAKYLIPFASFTTLQNPLHRKFVEISESTNVDKIKAYFDNSSYEIINLLPGESWNSKSNKFERIYTNIQRDKIHDKKNKINYGNSYYNKNNKHLDVISIISKEEVKDYFLKFNNVPEIIFCEDLKFRINILNRYEGDVNYSLTCNFQNGVLSISDIESHVDVEMWIPEKIISLIIKENLSWDEAHIGYWCRFTRNPDVFHQNFWRLIQTPYFVKQNSKNFTDKNKIINKNSNLAELLLNNPLNESVLRRYGMYCNNCGKSYAENIESGAKAHGLNDFEITKLIDELNFIN